MNENRKSEAQSGSTESPAPEAGKGSGRKAWYNVKIEAQEREIRDLKAKYEGSPEVQQRLDQLEAENGAQKHALGQRLGKKEISDQSIPGIAWLLMWQEYARRSKQFQFVGEQGLRSKADTQGNHWKIIPSISLNGMTEELAAMYREVAAELGYDAADFPEDAFLLHCQPDRGMYEIACADIEKHQAATIEAQKQFLVADKAVHVADSRGADDAARKAREERDIYQGQIDRIRRQFEECRAVIENAIQRFWLIRLEDLERMYEYGMEMRCMTVTVPMQKKYAALPKWAPQEEALVPASGEMNPRIPSQILLDPELVTPEESDALREQFR